MNTLERIAQICDEFKAGKFALEEFQSRLHTMSIEDDERQFLNPILQEVDNKIENILYCSFEKNFYEYGCEVADFLSMRVKK